MSKYGLWEIGNGTGNYHPDSPDARTETTITNAAVDEANRRYREDGIFIFKLHGGGYQRSGIPDVYVAIKGNSIWVEFKRPGADTTKLQRNKLLLLLKAGMFCGTAESTETFIDIIEQVKRLG